MKKLKLLLIFGGQSSEHDISRLSATSVYQHLNKDLYSISLVGIDKNGVWHQISTDVNDFKNNDWLKESQIIPDIYNFIKKHDVAFPVLHGLYGEDGSIQGLFELAKIPYVGCNILSSSLAMDKVFAKKVFEQAHIPQVKSLYIKKRKDGNIVYVNDFFEEDVNYIKAIENIIGYPCFIKPSNSGSSVGVNKANNQNELVKYIDYAAKFDNKILIEESIDGIELECAVIGNDDIKISSVGQILPAGDFYSFESKYEDANSKTVIPALVEQSIQDTIRELAKRAFRAVDGKGLSRVDFFLDNKTGNIYLNEVNTLPGFTSISMYPQLWIHNGLSYLELLDELIKLALE